MNLLLDTHVLLWWLNGEPALSKKAHDAIADGKNVVFVSAATIWEIRIKLALGKLTLPDDFAQVLAGQPFVELPVTWDHAHALANLPLHHRDPFDRLLVAQAQIEGLTIATRDDQLRKYKVSLLGA